MLGTGVLCSAILLPTFMAAAEAPGDTMAWSRDDLDQLAHAIGEAGARDGLPAQNYEKSSGQIANQDREATGAALSLAHDLYEGIRSSADAQLWHIPRSTIKYDQWLTRALSEHTILASLRALRPTEPAYAALSDAYLKCAEPHLCTVLRLNLDRWRQLPRDLGARYLWVNAAAYRVDLIDRGVVAASRRVIVGKPGSPTPVFRAYVTGVTANPWWNVPCGIVNESIGKLIRTRPAEAARRGYIASRGPRHRLTVRQRPGPANALGRVKLEMPNPYSVYLHDTPDRGLFDRDQRDLSHGCVRTEDPVTLADALLSKDGAAALDTALLVGASKTIKVSPPVPVYIVYFTAEPDGRGGITFLSDIYHRDRPVDAPTLRPAAPALAPPSADGPRF